MDFQSFPWIAVWIIGSGLALGIGALLENARHTRGTRRESGPRSVPGKTALPT